MFMGVSLVLFQQPCGMRVERRVDLILTLPDVVPAVAFLADFVSLLFRFSRAIV